MDAPRTCPYCAEAVAAVAVRCPHCRSRLAPFDLRAWHRRHPERRLAGVAAALARPLAVPVDLVRLAFVVLTFVHFLGPILYGALWLVVPPAPGETSLLERGLARAWALAAHLRGAPPGTRGPRPTGGGGAPNLPGEARSC